MVEKISTVTRSCIFILIIIVLVVAFFAHKELGLGRGTMCVITVVVISFTYKSLFRKKRSSNDLVLKKKTDMTLNKKADNDETNVSKPL